MEKRAKIFISHSHADSDIARAVADALEKEHLTVFSDAAIPAGANWSEEVERQLEASDVFLLLLSPEALASEWLLFEMGYIVAKEKEEHVKVLPIVVRDLKRQLIPLPLAGKQQLNAKGMPTNKLVEKIIELVSMQG